MKEGNKILDERIINFVKYKEFRFRLQNVNGWYVISDTDDEGNHISFTRVFYDGYTVDVRDDEKQLSKFLDENKKVLEVEDVISL